jgi:hypothetical protein
MKRKVTAMPKWLFAVLATGMLVASGLYIGMIRVQGPATAHLARAVGFGVAGVLMLCGAVGERR